MSIIKATARPLSGVPSGTESPWSFRANNTHPHLLLFVKLCSRDFRGRPEVTTTAAFQIREIFNIARLFGQQSRPDERNRIGEGGLFWRSRLLSR